MKAKKTVLLLAGLLGLFMVSFNPSEMPDAEGPIQTIIIDAGHGGKDPGAMGSKYKEKDLSLKVALQVKALLNEYMPHIRVVLSRDSDHFVELHKRAKLAQDHNADFFISIHCNSHPKSWITGTESYVLGYNRGQENYQTIVAENQAILFEENHEKMYGGFDSNSPEAEIYLKLLETTFRKESSLMANKIQTQFEDELGRKNLGVKQAPYIVLWQTGVPSVLVELGFMSNANEELFLGDETGQLFLASAIYRAVRDYNRETAPNN